MPVGQHQVAAFTGPNNGQAVDATVVKGNDDTLRAALNAHDGDPLIHIQSSTLATRPAAAVAGRLWFATDVGLLFFDDGLTWVPLGYIAAANANLTGTTLVEELIASVSLATPDLAAALANITEIVDGVKLTGLGYHTRVNRGDVTGAVVIDWAQGNIQRFRLTGNVTFSHTNAQPGASMIVELLQDGTGGRLVTGWGGVLWDDAQAGPGAMTALANRKDVFVLTAVTASVFHGQWKQRNLADTT